MNVALLAPEEETFPNRKRWTVAECYDLMNSGKLTGKFELIDGEVISKMGQKPPHLIAVILVVEWLRALFGARFVQSEDPIALPGPDGVYNEPEPDVTVTREPTCLSSLVSMPALESPSTGFLTSTPVNSTSIAIPPMANTPPLACITKGRV